MPRTGGNNILQKAHLFTLFYFRTIIMKAGGKISWENIKQKFDYIILYVCWHQIQDTGLLQYYRKLNKRNKGSLLSRLAPQINSTELDLRNPEQAGKWESTGIMLGCWIRATIRTELSVKTDIVKNRMFRIQSYRITYI